MVLPIYQLATFLGTGTYMRPAGGAAHIPLWAAVSNTLACQKSTTLLTPLDLSVCVLTLRRYAQPRCAGSKACEPGGHGGGDCGQQRHGRNQLRFTHGAAAWRPLADTGASVNPQSPVRCLDSAEWDTMGLALDEVAPLGGAPPSSIFPLLCQGSSVTERAGSSVRWHLGAGAPRAGAAGSNAQHRRLPRCQVLARSGAAEDQGTQGCFYSFGDDAGCKVRTAALLALVRELQAVSVGCSRMQLCVSLCLMHQSRGVRARRE